MGRETSGKKVGNPLFSVTANSAFPKSPAAIVPLSRLDQLGTPHQPLLTRNLDATSPFRPHDASTVTRSGCEDALSAPMAPYLGGSRLCLAPRCWQG